MRKESPGKTRGPETQQMDWVLKLLLHDPDLTLKETGVTAVLLENQHQEHSHTEVTLAIMPRWMAEQEGSCSNSGQKWGGL